MSSTGRHYAALVMTTCVPGMTQSLRGGSPVVRQNPIRSQNANIGTFKSINFQVRVESAWRLERKADMWVRGVPHTSQSLAMTGQWLVAFWIDKKREL